MKKVVYLLLFGAIVFASCERDPNFDQMDVDFIAYTKYDTTFTFKNTRVCVLDTITLVTNPDEVNPKWYNSTSQQITDRIKDNFTKLGYTLVDEGDARGPLGIFNTDYVVKVLAGKDITTVLYYYDPYWYYDWYDWWWWGGYYPYYPYYPYISGYSYETGTTIIHMADVTVRPNVSGSTEGYPIRWNAVMGGILGTGMDMTYELEAIDQVFAQSPYLKPDSNNQPR